jgi:hypothetical protein
MHSQIYTKADIYAYFLAWIHQVYPVQPPPGVIGSDLGFLSLRVQLIVANPSAGGRTRVGGVVGTVVGGVLLYVHDFLPCVTRCMVVIEGVGTVGNAIVGGVQTAVGGVATGAPMKSYM